MYLALMTCSFKVDLETTLTAAEVSNYTILVLVLFQFIDYDIKRVLRPLVNLETISLVIV